MKISHATQAVYFDFSTPNGARTIEDSIKEAIKSGATVFFRSCGDMTIGQLGTIRSVLEDFDSAERPDLVFLHGFDGAADITKKLIESVLSFE